MDPVVAKLKNLKVFPDTKPDSFRLLVYVVVIQNPMESRAGIITCQARINP